MRQCDGGNRSNAAILCGALNAGVQQGIEVENLKPIKIGNHEALKVMGMLSMLDANLSSNSCENKTRLART